MEGGDESIVLWRHPSLVYLFCTLNGYYKMQALGRNGEMLYLLAHSYSVRDTENI